MRSTLLSSTGLRTSSSPSFKLSVFSAFLGFLFASLSAHAQYNWIEKPSTGGPSPRCCMGSAYSSVSNGIILFGGADSNIDYNDTYLWTNHWSHLSPATAPPIRSSPGLAFDSVHNQVVLFGGNNDETETNLNDTWTFDGTNWTQQIPQTSPPGRGFNVTGMVFDAATGNTVLFGGSGYPSVYFGDTWTWDGTNWTQQFPANSPSPRRAPLVYDPATGTVILFGGDDAAGVHYNDTWSWDGTNWTQLTPATSPGIRTQAEMAFQSQLNRVLLFSGSSGYDEVYDDTWTWDGTNWTQIHPATEPLNRYAAPMAYNPNTKQMLTFGGYGVTGTNPRSDTWVFAP